MDSRHLLSDLTPVAERLLERHLASAKEWFPHEFVPWCRGRDFAPGETWDPDASPLDPAVRSALFVNLLTEDNLPYYTSQIMHCSATTACGAPGSGAGPPKKAGTRSCSATTSP